MNRDIIASVIILFIVWVFGLYVWSNDTEKKLSSFIETMGGFIFFWSCVYHVLFGESSIVDEEIGSYNWYVNTYEITVFATFVGIWFVIFVFKCVDRKCCGCSCFFLIRMCYFIFCLIQLLISSIAESQLTSQAIYGYNCGGMTISMLWMHKLWLPHLSKR